MGEHSDLIGHWLTRTCA